jgi:2-desacetyl-2-hydroxyethyl bacteriochlorophyllide A dehydrogenase
MKVVMLVGKQKLEVVEIDKPVRDGQNVIIKVIYCGICGSDIHYWVDGQGMAGVKNLIMGHEFHGTVDDPGAREDLKVGDRVTVVPANPCGKCAPCLKGWTNLCVDITKRPQPGLNGPGAYAEYIAVRPDMVRNLPDSIDDVAACTIEPLTVGLHTIRSACIKPGDRVFIGGAGIIGLSCAAWARVNGASYIAMAEVNDSRRDKARELGVVDDVFDGRDEKLNSKVKRTTGGGVDVAIDTSAAETAINSAILLLKPKGTLVLAGVSLKPQALTTLIALAKEITIKSVYAYIPSEFDMVMDFLAKGVVKMERFVSRIIRMNEAQDAFEDLHSGKTKDVKVVIRMQ